MKQQAINFYNMDKDPYTSFDKERCVNCGRLFIPGKEPHEYRQRTIKNYSGVEIVLVIAYCSSCIGKE